MNCYCSKEKVSRLDYKRDQYPFRDADKLQKSELLKDILAFANAWRQEDAYIIIGIEELNTGTGNPVGIDDHLDDADLQQFVNNKLNRNIDFSYNTFQYDDFSIGILKIPAQSHNRPFFARNKFGNVNSLEVKIRRGTSTFTADPDEIKRMGLAEAESRRTPAAKLSIADTNTKNDLGESAIYKNTFIAIPKEEDIPDYRSSHPSATFAIGLNDEFTRQLAKHIHEKALLSPLLVRVENTSKVLLQNSRIEIVQEKSQYAVN